MELRNRSRELLAIKSRRENRHITQRDVANETGIALSTLSRWFRNDVNRLDAHVVVALMIFFECTFDELFLLEDDTSSPEIKTPLSAA